MQSISEVDLGRLANIEFLPDILLMSVVDTSAAIYTVRSTLHHLGESLVMVETDSPYFKMDIGSLAKEGT